MQAHNDSFAIKLKPGFLQFYMCTKWDAAGGLPAAELEAIQRQGGPKAHQDDAHKIEWYNNMARKLYANLMHDDSRDEASFQRDFSTM